MKYQGRNRLLRPGLGARAGGIYVMVNGYIVDNAFHDNLIIRQSGSNHSCYRGLEAFRVLAKHPDGGHCQRANLSNVLNVVSALDPLDAQIATARVQRQSARECVSTMDGDAQEHYSREADGAGCADGHVRGRCRSFIYCFLLWMRGGFIKWDGTLQFSCRDVQGYGVDKGRESLRRKLFSELRFP